MFDMNVRPGLEVVVAGQGAVRPLSADLVIRGRAGLSDQCCQVGLEQDVHVKQQRDAFPFAAMRGLVFRQKKQSCQPSPYAPLPVDPVQCYFARRCLGVRNQPNL